MLVGRRGRAKPYGAGAFRYSSSSESVVNPWGCGYSSSPVAAEDYGCARALYGGIRCRADAL